MIFRILNRQPLFFFALLFFTVSGLVFLTVFSPRDTFVRLNFVHSSWLDTFFINCTQLGDGLFSVIVCLLLIWTGRTTVGIQVLITYLMSGLIAQAIKRIVAAPRPMAAFQTGEYQHFIEGITHSGNNSFPSGHTTSIFALATLLAFHSRNRNNGIIYLLIAITTGYSRIYLGQHFLEDVIAGAMIGVLTALFVYWILKEVVVQWKDQTQIRLSIN